MIGFQGVQSAMAQFTCHTERLTLIWAARDFVDAEELGASMSLQGKSTAHAANTIDVTSK